ncbi:MAG: oligosaccharide flippase family protein [Paludibacter sp.]
MKVNQLKAGAIMSYLLIGLGSIISIVYTPIMLRLLGQSEYGLYNLVSSVVSYLGLLSFGFGSAYIKYYSGYKANKDYENIAKLNGMFLSIFSVMGIVSIIAGVILVFNTENIFGSQLSVQELSTAKILMVVMVVNIAISFPAIVFNSYVTANEKFVFQRTLQIVKIITSPLLILPVLIMGYASVGMAIVTTILNFSIEFINAFYCYKKIDINFEFKKFDSALMRELFIFSSFIFMNLVVNQINWNVDRFIVGRFRGTIAVATYSLAAQLNTYYLAFSTALSGVFIPRVNAMVSSTNDNKELSLLFAKLGRLQFILLSLIITGLIFFGVGFIKLWAGNDYHESYGIALMLIVPVTLPLLQNLGIEIQRAKNMHKFRSWVYLFIAIGNVLISIPLVKLYGGIGAAAGTAIALVIGNVFVMNWYYHKKVGLDIKLFVKELIKISPALIIPSIVGVLMFLYMNLNDAKLLALGIFIYTIVFAISMWYLGINKYEKELVTVPYNRIKIKLMKTK